MHNFQCASLLNSPGYIYTDKEFYYVVKDAFENSLDPSQTITRSRSFWFQKWKKKEMEESTTFCLSLHTHLH